MLDKRVFALFREDEQGSEQILCIVNVTDETVELELPPVGWRTSALCDLLSDFRVELQDAPVTVVLQPYQSMWLCSKE